MRIALAQINPTIGDLERNAGLIREAAVRAATSGADLLVLPELCVCGYPPRDLLHERAFITACERTAAEIGRTLGDGATAELTVVMGVPLACHRGPGVTNSLVAWRGSEQIATYHKRLLPTYDVFDEARYFHPGDAPAVIDVAGVRVGLAICEDLWRGEDAGTAERYAGETDPVAELIAAGARVIVAASASPYVMGKHTRHTEIVRTHASRHAAIVCSVNQVGGNDDVVFDGRSCVVDASGTIVGQAAAFETGVLVADIDAGTCTVVDGATEETNGPYERRVLDALTLGVRDYAHKSGFTKACLGLSGGIDSALTAAIAVRALGAENVLGVRMPGKYSSEHSLTDAADLAEMLGMPMITLPIEAGFSNAAATLNHVFAEIGEPALGAKMPDLTEENLQSRVRGLLMMGLSNRTGALLLTTGNKSELAVGYSTLYGDMNGGLAVLSDVLKTRVFDLSRFVNTHASELGFDTSRFETGAGPIPISTIEKPPSAELAPDQKDSDSLPAYPVLDEIVRRRVELREAPAHIAAETGFDRVEVERVCRLIARNEYKRFQLAIGLKITPIAFGPGRRLPLVQRWV